MAAVDALAAKHGIKRHAAILWALKMGLFVDDAGAVLVRNTTGKPVAAFSGPGTGAVKMPPRIPSPEPMRMPRAPIGSLAKKPRGRG